MGLFEQVQADLFEFIGLKPKEMEASNPKKTFNLVSSLEDLHLPIEINRQAYAKGVSFSVTHKGTLKIRANRSLTESEIFKAIKPHLDWIQAQHLERERIKLKFQQKKWQTGEVFLFEGRLYRMVLTPSETKRPFIRFMSESFEYFYPSLWKEEAPEVLQKNLHEGLLKFFKKQSSLVLNPRVNHWSETMGLFPKSVTYRNQKSRWGSCSSKGTVNLNWKLACFDQSIQDYVIIHELAHLEHQNHSKRFWSLVYKHYPNYKEVSKNLNKQAFHVDCFLPKSELYEVNPSL